MFRIITAYDDKFKNLGDLTSKNKKAYAKHRGYGFNQLSITEDVLPPNWIKLMVLVSQMSNSGDWLFWSDADSLIMNFNMKLEDMISDDKDMIFGFHMVDPSTNMYFPHGGNFLIRDCPESVDFLHRAIKRFEFEIKDRMMEERAFRTILLTHEGFKQRTAFVKLNKLCTVPEEVIKMGAVGFEIYSPGDFINHFMSPLTTYDRISMVDKYSKMVLK